MGVFEIHSLKKVGLSELTKIWNRCWQGYYYEMTFTQEQMQVWLELGGIALEQSLVLVWRDQPFGFSLLATQQEQGWIAGTGLAPEARGQGLFMPLIRAQLNEARRLELKDVYLEVLIQNHAQKVYEAVGFHKVRNLNVYRVGSEEWPKLRSFSLSDLGLGKELADLQGYQFFRQTTMAEYFDARCMISFKPAWQRREAYLSRYRNPSAFLTRGDTAGFLLAGEEGEILLDAWCSGPRNGLQVLNEVFRRTGKIILTDQPEDWLSVILGACKIKPQEIQVEMLCDLR